MCPVVCEGGKAKESRTKKGGIWVWEVGKKKLKSLEKEMRGDCLEI